MSIPGEKQEGKNKRDNDQAGYEDKAINYYPLPGVLLSYCLVSWNIHLSSIAKMWSKVNNYLVE